MLRLRDCSGKVLASQFKKKKKIQRTKKRSLEIKVMIGEMRSLIEGLEDKVMTFQEEDQKEKKEERVEEKRLEDWKINKKA